MIRQQQQYAEYTKYKKLRCGIPAHKCTDPHTPTHTHTYHSTQHTRICYVNTRICYVYTRIVSSDSHKLALRLLLYRGCNKVELKTLRDGVLQTWYGSSSSKQSTKTKCRNVGFQHTNTHTRTHLHTCIRIIAHTTHTRILYPHTHSSGPHKLDVRPLCNRGCHQVESFYSSGPKQLICGSSIVLLGSTVAPRKAIPWLLPRFRDFYHPEHVPRTSAGAQTSAVCTRVPPASPAAEERAATGKESLVMCKTNISNTYAKFPFEK